MWGGVGVLACQLIVSINDLLHMVPSATYGPSLLHMVPCATFGPPLL